MDLSITSEERDGWVIVRVAGDLDLATAPRLRAAVVDAVSQGNARVVLDLERVDFVDSLGVGVLVGAVRRTRTNGGDLLLVSTRAHLQRLFELTGLAAGLPLFPDVDSALAAAGSTRG